LKRSSTALIVALVFVAVVVHLSVSWQEFATLAKNGYLYDDSFYDFQIARNIAEGRGPTFDGITYTNGFQPLYVFILVPFFWLFGSNTLLPIYAGLTALALLTAATAYLLFLITRRYVGDKIAIVATALWVFSPIVIKQSSNGLETALALLLFACCVYYYLDRIRSKSNPPRSAFVKLGLLLGLATLARVDEIFLALAMALDYLLMLRRQRAAPRWVFGNVGVAALCALLVYVPWVVYSLIAVGSPFQESGVATRLLSISYAPFFSLGSSDMVADGPGLSFIWVHLVHSASVLKLSPPVHVVFRAVEKLGIYTGTAGVLLVAMNVVGLGMLVGFTAWIVRVGKANGNKKRSELNFLLLFSVLLIAAYSLYVFGMFFFTRYYYPVYFVVVVFAACFMRDVVDWLSRRATVYRRVAVGLLSLYVVGLLYMGYTAGFKSTPVYHFYDIAKWVENHTDESDTIGVFQSGAIGYLSHRRVVNLDGKVNKNALAALKCGKLWEYVRDTGIDVVLDHKVVLELFLGSCSDGTRTLVAANRCFNGSAIGADGWIGYRVSPAVGQNAGAFHAAPGGSHD
jgi:hypothetical protein